MSKSFRTLCGKLLHDRNPVLLSVLPTGTWVKLGSVGLVKRDALGLGFRMAGLMSITVTECFPEPTRFFTQGLPSRDLLIK
jgi:hypothetical protein